MILEVLRAPHESLTIRSYPVADEQFDDDLAKIAEDMIETMHNFGGIGLAANQVDILSRIIVIRFHNSKSPMNAKDLVLVNPEIVERNSKKVHSREGCLSVPGTFATNKRAKNIVVEYQDVRGESFRKKFTGIDALCVQHEIDHLDGVLMTDNALKVETR